MLITNVPTKKELIEARARFRHLEFMKYCWGRKRPFHIGLHTIKICKEIDRAFERFRDGISTFLMVLVCFRQGKSEIVSRFLPPHFLGEFPDSEVILTSHSQRMANKFSRFGRNILKTEKFKKLYPKIELSSEAKALEEWGIENKQGVAQFFGITSGIAGVGGNLIIVDDYFGTRESAESEVMREKVWDCFTDNVWTRRNHPNIFLICCTPWHIDDLVGRIKKKMVTERKYPKFKVITFPAKHKDYPSGYLFPEMYPESWYEEMEVVLQKYGSASLMYCDPQVKSGNMLRTDKVKYYEDDDEIPEGIKFTRGWDLASSKKQRTKQDPDWTVGVKLGVQWIPSLIRGQKIPILYIDDVVRGQWEATQRNKVIRDTTINDGFLRCGIEAFAAYKDAFTQLRDVLKGIRHVESIRLSGDKVSKASPLEPIFEAGNVYLRKADWNFPFLKVVNQFPGGAKDDDVDALDVAFSMHQSGGIQIYTGSMYEEMVNHRDELKETVLDRLIKKQTIGCNLEEYTSSIREVMRKQLNSAKGDYRKFVRNEIVRLDRALRYTELVVESV